MTIQVLLFLFKARRVQKSECGEIYINDVDMQIQTEVESGESVVISKISKNSDQLCPMLEYMERKNLIKVLGQNYFSLEYDGYHYFQTMVSSVIKFMLSSVAVPIAVAFITTLISLWLTGVFTAPQQ